MFQDYKKITYPIYSDETIVFDKTVTNISSSFFISTTRSSETNIPFIFQSYELEEYESPIMVSDRLYSTTKYYWILLVINSVVNPYTDWFMSQETLRNYTIKKYQKYKPSLEYFLTLKSGISNQTYQEVLDSLKSTYKDSYFSTYEYSQLIQNFEKFKVDIIESSINDIHHYLDTTTNLIISDYKQELYSTGQLELPVYIIPVTNFEFEYQENLKKKIIKVLDPTQIDRFVSEIANITR